MKLLFDENIPLCVKANVESKKNKVRHVSEIQKGATDNEVFLMALKNKECIVTNDHHFDKYSKQKNYGIIRLSSGLSKFGEKHLTAVLAEFKKNETFENKYIKINQTDYIIKYNKYSNSDRKFPRRYILKTEKRAIKFA